MVMPHGIVRINRKQLEQCTDLLSEIIPIFIVIMIENPNVNWEN